MSNDWRIELIEFSRRPVAAGGTAMTRITRKKPDTARE
jgi:hypothetical protein